MWYSFFIYSVLTALLPGPNNILALNSVMKIGFKKTQILLYGIYAGFTFVIFRSAICTELILNSYSGVLEFLKYVGVIYLLYLAWIVARSKPVQLDAVAAEQEELPQSRLFWKAFFLQLVNVKIIIYGITAFSNFIFPQFEDFRMTLVFAVFLSAVGCTATWIWAFAGDKLALFLNKYARTVNLLMALLLVYCAISLVI